MLVGFGSAKTAVNGEHVDFSASCQTGRMVWESLVLALLALIIAFPYAHADSAHSLYHGYWGCGCSDFGDVPVNYIMAWPGEVARVVDTLGYSNVMLYLGGKLNATNNGSGKEDIEVEEYWPTFFSNIAAQIQGYEDNIMCIYLEDEPYARAQRGPANWYETRDTMLSFDQMPFVLAADFTGDGADDLALFHDEGSCACDRQKIYVLAADPSTTTFQNRGAWFDMPNEWFTFAVVDFAVAGDFDNDGIADIATFYDYCSGRQCIFMHPSDGTNAFRDYVIWYDTTNNVLDFDKLKHVLVGDYTGDGIEDLALFYSEGPAGTNRQKILVFESDTARFVNRGAWFDMPNDWFSFTYVNHAVSGDFDGDGIDDVAMFYDYPSGPQKVFVWTSDGTNAFRDKGAWFETTNDVFDFECLKAVLASERDDYNGDHLDDLTMFYDYPDVDGLGNAPQREYVRLSEGSLTNGGFSDHSAWFDIEKRYWDFDYCDFFLTGDFDGDGLDDVVMLYDYPSGLQRFFVARSRGLGAWTDVKRLGRLIDAAKKQFRDTPITFDFMKTTVMRDNTIPPNIDWVMTDPYPWLENVVPEFPDPAAWCDYTNVVVATVERLQHILPEKPILLISKSFSGHRHRMPTPQESAWYYETVRNRGLIGLCWFIYHSDPGNGITGVVTRGDLLDVHKQIGQKMLYSSASGIAIASSVEAAGLEPSSAVDGDPATRWSSEFTDDEWIYIDFVRPRIFDTVRLNWETAYGRQYEIQISDDAARWTTIFTETDGDGGIDVIYTGTQTSRYVRMRGMLRGTPWGYSLWEFEVYAADADEDGLPDYWERRYFADLTNMTASSDVDGDGFPDWNEYVAGTDPTNALSRLEMSGQSEAEKTFVVRWPSVSGKYYSLYRCTNLMNGFSLLEPYVRADPSVNFYTDAVSGVGAAYYRIKVEQ